MGKIIFPREGCQEVLYIYIHRMNEGKVLTTTFLGVFYTCVKIPEDQYMCNASMTYIQISILKNLRTILTLFALN